MLFVRNRVPIGGHPWFRYTASTPLWRSSPTCPPDRIAGGRHPRKDSCTSLLVSHWARSDNRQGSVDFPEARWNGSESSSGQRSCIDLVLRGVFVVLCLRTSDPPVYGISSTTKAREASSVFRIYLLPWPLYFGGCRSRNGLACCRVLPFPTNCVERKSTGKQMECPTEFYQQIVPQIDG